MKKYLYFHFWPLSNECGSVTLYPNTFSEYHHTLLHLFISFLPYILPLRHTKITFTGKLPSRFSNSIAAILILFLPFALNESKNYLVLICLCIGTREKMYEWCQRDRFSFNAYKRIHIFYMQSFAFNHTIKDCNYRAIESFQLMHKIAALLLCVATANATNVNFHEEYEISIQTQALFRAL